MSLAQDSGQQAARTTAAERVRRSNEWFYGGRDSYHQWRQLLCRHVVAHCYRDIRFYGFYTLAVPFSVGDFIISGAQSVTSAPGAQIATNIKLATLHSYEGKSNVPCDARALASSLCSLAPLNPISLASGGEANLTATLNIPKDATQAHRT